MKNTIVKILIIAILFIPSYLAVYEYLSSVSQPVEEDSVTEMILTDPSGHSISFSRGNKEEERTINYFVSLRDKSRSISELPKDLEGSTHYVVTYKSFGKTTSYDYYFSKTKPSNSYFTDNNNKAYRIPASSVIEFLDSEYSTYMYPASQTPSMVLGDKVILPTTLNWHYYSYSNVSHTVSSQTQSSAQKISVSYRSFEIAFDRFADSIDIEINYPSGSSFYSGSYSQFKEMGAFEAITQDTIFNVTITAKWNDSPALGFGGLAIYELILDTYYNPPGTFWLGEDSIEAGEFVVLSGINVEDPEKIKCTVSPQIGYSPVFYNDQGTVRAIIPFPVTLGNETKTYTVCVEYLGIITELPITVKKNSYEFKTRKYNYNSPVNVAARTSENLESFKNFVLMHEYSDKVFFQGSFTVPTESIRAKYGDTINNTSNSKDKFTSGGYAIVAYSTTDILSMNYGTVVAVGTTQYGGKTVVIDHGLGLRSVYYCLKTVNVMEGEYVKPGSVIGSGSVKDAGYTDGITAYIELWVHDIPVSSDFLVAGGRTGMIVYGTAPEED